MRRSHLDKRIWLTSFSPGAQASRPYPGIRLRFATMGCHRSASGVTLREAVKSLPAAQRAAILQRYRDRESPG